MGKKKAAKKSAAKPKPPREDDSADNWGDELKPEPIVPPAPAEAKGDTEQPCPHPDDMLRRSRTSAAYVCLACGERVPY
jgi:hypothetical protein